MFDSKVSKAILFVATVGPAVALVVVVPAVAAWSRKAGPVLLAVVVALLVLLALVVANRPSDRDETAMTALADDQALFDRLIALLPATFGVIPLLRDGYPPGSRFDWRPIRPLEQIERLWSASTMRFRDARIDECRATLVARTTAYLDDLRGNSFIPDDAAAPRDESYIPTDWANYHEVLVRLREQSCQVAAAHDAIVAAARRAGLSVREPPQDP